MNAVEELIKLREWNINNPIPDEKPHDRNKRIELSLYPESQNFACYECEAAVK